MTFLEVLNDRLQSSQSNSAETVRGDKEPDTSKTRRVVDGANVPEAAAPRRSSGARTGSGVVLSKDWKCPKCAKEYHGPIRASMVICPGSFSTHKQGTEMKPL